LVDLLCKLGISSVANFIHFVSAVVAVVSSHWTASSSASQTYTYIF